MSGPLEYPEKQLLRRIVPSGFIPYLSMPMLSKEEEDQLDTIERGGEETHEYTSVQDISSGFGTNIDRLRSRIQILQNRRQPQMNRNNRIVSAYFSTCSLKTTLYQI